MIRCSTMTTENDNAPDPTQDIDRALQLVAAHRHEIRWCPEWEKWLVWDGKRWQRDAGGLTVQKMSETFGRTNSAIKNLMQLAKAHLITHSDDFDAHENLVNCPNGIIDLYWQPTDEDFDEHGQPNFDTDVYRSPHDSAMYLTKMTGVPWTQTPQMVFDYYMGSDRLQLVPRPPSRWELFLERVQPDPDVRDYLQRWAGYMLFGGIRDHEMLVLEGEGANGKSVFMKVLLGVMGDYAAPGSHSLLIEKNFDDHPTALAQVKGLRMVVVSETPRNARINEARLSQLTAGDRVLARHMREDFWSFTPTAKLVMVTNHRPEIPSGTEAIWRRIRRVPWPVTIPVEDRINNLEQPILANEGEHVLDWMFDGWFKYQTNGLTMPSVLAQSNEQYRAEQDVIGQYISEMGYITGSTNDLMVTCSDFNYGLDAWCKHSGMERPTRNERTRMMQKKGFIRRQTNKGWHWFGLAKSNTESALNQMRNPT